MLTMAQRRHLNTLIFLTLISAPVQWALDLTLKGLTP